MQSVRSNRSKFIAGLLASLVASSVASSAFAQGASFPEAVETFNTGNYPQAADMFVQVLRATPQDPLAHYYLGVSWHCLGRVPEAMAEYKWVASNSQDPELVKRVQMGMQVLSRVQQPAPSQLGQYGQNPPAQPGQYGQNPPSQQQYGQYPPSPAFGQPRTTGHEAPQNAPTGWLSQTGVQRAIAANPGQAQYARAATQPVAGQPRIIDLYTSWCGWCKVFEPIFVQAQGKYGNLAQFERLNAELSPNKALVKKYRVQGYPTILLLDGSGKLVKRIDGAPRSLEEFEQDLFQAFPQFEAAQSAPMQPPT
jgi:thiol-disulfide isomerase/thioredoxin